MRITPEDRRAERLLVATVALLTLAALPLNHDTNSGRYVAQALALWEDHSFSIDRYHSFTVDKSMVDGRYYPSAAPGLSVAVLPAAALATEVFDRLPAGAVDDLARLAGPGDRLDPPVDSRALARFLLAETLVRLLFCVPVACLLAVGVFRLTGVHPFPVSARARAALTALALAGSFCMFYLPRLYSHVPAAALACWSLVVVARPPSAARALLAGMLVATLPLVDYPMLVAALPLLAACAWQLRCPRLLALLAAGGLPPTAAFFAYHAVHFGGPLTLANRFSASYPVHHDAAYGLTAPTLASIADLAVGLKHGLLPYALLPAVGVAFGLRVIARRPPRDLFLAAWRSSSRCSASRRAS